MNQLTQTPSVPYILTFFEDIPDPRRTDQGNLQHPFTNILFMALVATIGGADAYTEMEDFAHAHRDFLAQHIDLSAGIPSHDTFKRVLEHLNPTTFEKAFSGWVQEVCSGLPELSNKEIIAIDGKTACGSGDRTHKALHIVSAWATEASLCLGQVSCHEKSNEIEAIPRLLQLLAIKGSIVTTDAMGCQKAIASDIINQGGDYVLCLKENHPTLYKSVKEVVKAGEESIFKKMHNSRTLEKDAGHGRYETRRYTLITPKESGYFKKLFPGFKSIGVVETKRTSQALNNDTVREIRYYITSLGYEERDDFKRAVRNHWHVENKLHWQLDVSFREDDCRVREGHGAENLNIIRKLALMMIKAEPSKGSVKGKRKKAGWDNKLLNSIIGK